MRTELLTALLLLSLTAGATESTLRVYYIGNSVTDTIRYKPLADLAATRGVKIDWGRHMIPGAPLEWLYTHENDGFREKPYGGWRVALNNFAWDAVSFQPFDRSFHGTNTAGQAIGDLDLITELSRMAAGKNPDVRILVYARWPRMRSGGKPFSFDKNAYDPAKPGNGYDLAKLDPWASCWEAGYDPATRKGSNEAREYFEKLHAAVVENTKFLKKPAELVRVGHAMAALDAKMKAGEVPGYTTVWQLYKDGIHLNETGSYLVGCVYFAHLLHQNPEGLTTAPYGNVDAKLAPLIQKQAWETTKTTKESKLK
ncbi:MAG: hypothetical protein WCJ02_04630 [bacterium]